MVILKTLVCVLLNSIASHWEGFLLFCHIEVLYHRDNISISMRVYLWVRYFTIFPFGFLAIDNLIICEDETDVQT